MALTKIGATLGGSADVITVTQNSHGLILGRPVKMTSSGYAHATADTAANAEAIGIVIASDWDGSSGANTTFTLALSGRITVDGCVPNLAAGSVFFLQVASGLLAAAEPDGNNQVSKPMAVVTVANSEMIMVQQRGEVVSTGSATIADNSVTNAKVATGIDAVKIADGSVTNAELQYINSLSSNAQDQITVVENDIKQLTVTANYLALRVTALASLGDYNLGNIMIDDFQDTTGIDASNSTNEVHNNTNKYYAGTIAGSGIDSYVKLMMHFDNNLTDSSDSNHTVTDTGNASFAFEGTTKKFGSHSGNFGAGTQRKLTVAASSDWLMGSDPWTVDFWLYYQNSGEIFGDYNTFRIFIESNKIKFKGGGINTYLANTELTQNTWLHIAVQRGAAGNGANIRAWVNGTHYGYQTANTTSMGSSSTAPIIGHGDAWLGVYMDELRVSKGIARYPDNTNSITVPTSAYTSPSHQNMTLLSNATTATDVPTKGDLLITYEDSSGTATLNTDLKGYISRNNGSTYTQGTLVAEGTIGTQKVAAFHDVDISGQSSGSAIKYKIETLNQSATKGTNIHGVAMGWS